MGSRDLREQWARWHRFGKTYLICIIAQVPKIARKSHCTAVRSFGYSPRAPNRPVYHFSRIRWCKTNNTCRSGALGRNKVKPIFCLLLKIMLVHYKWGDAKLLAHVYEEHSAETRLSPYFAQICVFPLSFPIHRIITWHHGFHAWLLQIVWYQTCFQQHIKGTDLFFRPEWYYC